MRRRCPRIPWTRRSPLRPISSEIEDVISMLIKHKDEVDQVDLLVAGGDLPCSQREILAN